MLRVYEIILMAAVALSGIVVFAQNDRQKKRSRILYSFEKFLGTVIKQYGRSENIREAVDEAGASSDKIMKRECGYMSDALNAPEHSDFVIHYIRGIKEPFIKEFFSLCSSIRSFGDTVYMGASLFDRNVRYIKEEVRMDILMREEEGFLFSGLMPLILIPFFMIIPIEVWAYGISSDMKGYYEGSFGLITLTGCFAVTLITIWLVTYLKNPGTVRIGRIGISDMILRITPVRTLLDAHIERHYSHYLRKNEELKRLRGFGNIHEFMVRQLLFMLSGFILSFFLCFAAFLFERHEALRPVELNEYKVYNMDETLKAQLSERLTEYFDELRRDGVRGIEAVSEFVRISGDETIQSACEQVLYERLEEFYEVRFGTIYIMIMALSTILGFNVPHIMLLLCNWQNELLKQRETLQFQTLILILMHHDGITVEEILRWMELFAGVFVIAFERAVDDYSFRRGKALDNLRLEVNYEPLNRIIECLISCDDITVERAFADLENERSYNLEQYRQTNTDSLKERAAFARIIAFLPFVSILALRLVIPFVLTGLAQLNGYSSMLGK